MFQTSNKRLAFSSLKEKITECFGKKGVKAIINEDRLKRIKLVINKKNSSKEFNFPTDNMSLIYENMFASQKVTFSLINDTNISFITR